MTHPDRNQHIFYDPSADFTEDISDLAFGTESRWWEPLGKSQLLIHLDRSAYNFQVEAAEAARKDHVSENTPPQVPQTFQCKVKLLLPEKPNPQQNIGEDMPMAVNEVLEVSAANTGLF